jgi:glycoprotease/Kae1 family metallohydrolase
MGVLSNIVSSQIDIHKLYGGVVPEIASRNHAMAILGVCKEALDVAGVTLDDITHFASVTEPGLRGAVMIGRVFGEGLAMALNKPFIPINHLHGHMASVAIDNDVPMPHLSLLVSGGHTSLYRVNSWQDIQLLVTTADDAVGEAFDKVAKILGLEYPGGVQIERKAQEFFGHCERSEAIQHQQDVPALGTSCFRFISALGLSANPPALSLEQTVQYHRHILAVACSFQHEAAVAVAYDNAGFGEVFHRFYRPVCHLAMVVEILEAFAFSVVFAEFVKDCERSVNKCQHFLTCQRAVRIKPVAADSVGYA